jgi:hypothetical protein
VHVEGGDAAGPREALLVVRLLGDGGDGAADADPVGPHRHPHRLAVGPEHVELEGVGVLLSELEDVADLDAAVDGEGRPAPGARVTAPDLGGGDGPVRLEVAAHHDVDLVATGLVGAGGPRAAPHHERVDEVADAQLPQASRPDVAPHEPGVVVEGVEGQDLGRLEVRTEPLEVDLPVTRHADHEGLLRAVGLAQRDHHVLERLGGVEVVAGGLQRADQRLDRRAVRGVHDLRRRLVGRVALGRGPHLGGLGVGRVVARRARHEGVLAAGGGREELLGRAPAHGAADRRHDAVVEAEPPEGADVGAAVQLVAVREPGVVEVEGVAVLHGELAPRRMPARGRASSRYFTCTW